MDYLDDLEMDHIANRFLLVDEDERWNRVSVKVKGKVLNKNMTCQYCGKKNLHWEDSKTGWRLFDKKGKLHSCVKYSS